MNPDGSESRIEDLSTTTLRAAMLDIQQNFEAARKLQSKMDRREGTDARHSRMGVRSPRPLAQNREPGGDDEGGRTSREARRDENWAETQLYRLKLKK